MKTIITAAILALSIGSATAATSDEWTFEQWADYCGDAWLDGTEKTEDERRAEGTNHDNTPSVEMRYEEAMTYHERAVENMRVYIERMNDGEVSDYRDANLLYGVEEEL